MASNDMIFEKLLNVGNDSVNQTKNVMESDINGLDKLPEKSLKDGGQDKTFSIFRHQLRTINK